MLKATIKTTLQRKDPRLPVYLVIPEEVIAPWRISGTTVVEGTANGHSFGRRNIKAWGKGSDNWFVELTAPFCKVAKLNVGDFVALELWMVDTSTPDELTLLLSKSKALLHTWDNLSDRERREASEHIRTAKAPETRMRRAVAVVAKLRGTS